MRARLSPGATLALACAAALAAAVLAGVLTPPRSQAAHQLSKTGCTSSGAQAGALVTPAFSLPPSSAATLTYKTFWEIESVSPSGHDVMTVEYTTDGGTTWQELERLNPTSPPSGGQADFPLSNQGLQTPPAWETRTVALTALEGAPSAQLRFRFDSIDALYQGFRGWGVDSVVVSHSSASEALNETFDAGAGQAPPSGWSASGLWHAHDNPEDTQILEPDIDPALVTLASADAGLLPGDPSGGARIAWFGDGTGTYCGEDFGLAVSLDPGSAAPTVGQTLQVTIGTETSSIDAGACVRWSVAGANPRSQQTVNVPQGEHATTIALTASNAGADTLSAELDAGCDGSAERTAIGFYDWQPPPAAAAPPPPAPALSLPEPVATRTVTERHTLLARTTDVAAGVPVRFAISGANAGSGAVPVDGALGGAAIGWTGRRAGRDSVSVFVDLDRDGARGAGEPHAEATVDWRSLLATDLDIEQAATLAELSDPPPGRVNVQATGGSVLIRLPARAAGARAGARSAQAGFIPLNVAAQVPIGSILEPGRRGKVAVEAAQDARASRTGIATFQGGRFQVSQTRGARPVTQMTLKGGSFRACRRASAHGSAVAGAARHRSRRVRRLWGSGRGRYRTRGRYSSATVRGTRWLVEDRCDGTLTRVARGRVDVRDMVRRRTVRLRAGRSYLARSRRGG